MLKTLLCAMLVWSVSASDGGSIVQFLVFAEDIVEINKAFPGASVDYTWNNVFVVTVWTDDPSTAIPAIQATIQLWSLYGRMIPARRSLRFRRPYNGILICRSWYLLIQ
jgi:hypothetical protein